MNINVGKTDRIIRLLAGIFIIAAGIYFQSWWGTIGLILILTGMFSWCPAYTLLGIRTASANKESVE